MKVVTCSPGGTRAIVSRPDGRDRGRLSLDIAATLAMARRERASAWLLPATSGADSALLALTSDEVPVTSNRRNASCEARWWLAAAVDAVEQRSAVGASSFWQEIYIELRRQAGRDSVPPRVRERLKRLAQGAFTRFTARSRAASQLPRRLLRDPVRVRLDAALRADAEGAAAALGVGAAAPVIALELRTRAELLAPAIDLLGAKGYTVVRIGDSTMGPCAHPRVVDLALAPHRTALLELHLLLRSDFLICGSSELQWMAYLLDRPCLRLNATDAIAAYPIRGDGLFTLATPVDLDSGALLGPADMLTERYYRNQRNFGFRDTPAAEIRAAVAEMLDAVSRGWHETGAQASFRGLATAAANDLAPRVAQVARWGADEGFLGDGRLAGVQAARAS